MAVPGTIDQKTYLKKFRGASAPLAPPGSAYEYVIWEGGKEANHFFLFQTSTLDVGEWI